MGRTTNGLIKSRRAVAATPGRRFVTEGPVKGSAALAVDASKAIIGCTSELDTDAGRRMDVFMAGNVGELIAGGNIAPGDKLTADAQGRAVATTTANANYGAIAEDSGVLGDIIAATITPGATV